MKKELSIVTLFIVIDQIVKLLAINIKQPIELIPDFLQLSYVKNFGVAWSMFNNQRMFIILFINICYIFFRIRCNSLFCFIWAFLILF